MPSFSDIGWIYSLIAVGSAGGTSGCCCLRTVVLEPGVSFLVGSVALTVALLEWFIYLV